MDKRVFIQIGNALVRKQDGERRSEPIFIEANRLYKLHSRHGIEAHTGGEAARVQGGYSTTMPPRNNVTQGGQTNG